MESYNSMDVMNMSKLFFGEGAIILPKSIKVDENVLYEYCYDTGCDTDILDESIYSLNVLSTFLLRLCKDNKLLLFIDYYFNKFIESKATDLAIAGYNIFLLKDTILSSLNAVWSIPNQEFGIDNSKLMLKEVKFKEYDKMGEGGFCTVYRCATDVTRVYKVLNTIEKSDAGSIYRFRREYEIMHEHNDCGYTLNVFDYDSQALTYSMEKADISLEDYIKIGGLEEVEKDSIIIRCAECMNYLHNHSVIHRDFHPGNILRSTSGKWMITDFGLAKDISHKYSHQTTTTHALGRACVSVK